MGRTARVSVPRRQRARDDAHDSNSGWRGPIGLIAEKGGDAEVTLKNYLNGLDWLAAEFEATGFRRTTTFRIGKYAMKIGFHTDAFNSHAFSFEKALQWAQKNGVHYIEPGLIDGVGIHGLGYFPHVALYEDPLMLRRKMETYGVRFSQVDAAFPFMDWHGPSRGLPYVLKAIPWAAHAGCSHVATTDGLRAPEDLTDSQAIDHMKRSYEQIIACTKAYNVTVTIEVHGYFTTNPDRVEQMLNFVIHRSCR